MSDRHEDDAFVDRLRAAWPAPTLTPSDRVRFDAVLRDRIAQRGRRRRAWLGLGLATAVAAAAFTLFTLSGPVDVEAPPAPAPAIAAEPDDFAPLAALIESDALDALDLDDVGLFDDDLFADDDLFEEGDDDTETEDGVEATADVDDTVEDEEDDSGWMPAEYDTLAMLIDVDPYTTEELWP